VADRPAQRAKPEPSGIDDIPVWTRRAVVLGMCVTAAAALTVGERLVFPSRRWLGDPEEPLEPRTLPWALRLAEGPDAELWRQARWFCWTAASHAKDARIRRGLERLVRMTLDPSADAAADEFLGHAIHVLRAAGEWQQLRQIADSVATRTSLPRSRALLAELLGKGSGR
jgi:hypothetical protein